MNSRYSHKAKTHRERGSYSKYIKRLDYSPTIDETLPFPSSEKAGEDLSEPTTKRARKIPFQDKIKDHFADNFINWIVGATIFIFIFLVYDSKIDIARLNSNIGTFKESISELKEYAKSNLSQLHTHDLKIQENKIRIENLKDQQKYTSNNDLGKITPQHIPHNTMTDDAQINR